MVQESFNWTINNMIFLYIIISSFFLMEKTCIKKKLKSQKFEVFYLIKRFKNLIISHKKVKKTNKLNDESYLAFGKKRKINTTKYCFAVEGTAIVIAVSCN